MKIRPFFLGLAAGVYLTALISYWRFNATWDDFRMEAFHHGAMMYFADMHSGKITRWMWMDDYIKLKLSCPSYTPPPTPDPRWTRL